MPESVEMKSSSPIDRRNLLKAWLTAEGVTDNTRLALRTLRCSIIASKTRNRLRSIMPKCVVSVSKQFRRSLGSSFGSIFSCGSARPLLRSLPVNQFKRMAFEPTIDYRNVQCSIMVNLSRLRRLLAGLPFSITLERF